MFPKSIVLMFLSSADCYQNWRIYSTYASWRVDL